MRAGRDRASEAGSGGAAPLGALLQRAGYRVIFRAGTWIECLVHRDAERWLGRGPSQAEALRDAVAKMLPSHFARALLRSTAVAPPAPAIAIAALAPPPPEPLAAPPPVAVVVPPPAPAAEPAAPPAPAVPAEIAAPIEVAEAAAEAIEATPAAPAMAPLQQPGVSPSADADLPAPAGVDQPAAGPGAGVDQPAAGPGAGVDQPAAGPGAGVDQPAAGPGAGVDQPAAGPGAGVDQPAAGPSAGVDQPVAGPGAGVDHPAAGPGAGVDAAPIAPAPAPERSLTPAEQACRDLERMLAGIESELPVFARLSPDRQRLKMLIWVTRARRVEEAFPGDSDVERHTGALVRRLSDLGKRFWPGMVRALQLNARPANVPELRVRWAPTPASWAEAAELTDGLWQTHIAECVAAGLDADGWVPEPPEAALSGDAEKVFKEAVLALDSTLLAVLGGGKSAVLNAAQLERLLGAARKLRWARTRVRDTVAWGAAMGSLRKLLPTVKMRGKRVENAIDPLAKPEPPW